MPRIHAFSSEPTIQNLCNNCWRNVLGWVFSLVLGVLVWCGVTQRVSSCLIFGFSLIELEKSERFLWTNLQGWETTQNGCKVRCAQGWELFSLRSDLSSGRLCEEKYVTVMSTVSCCDVTTVQQHHKGSTSTPPRVARLCQIREASLVALRNFKNLRMLTCVDRSTRPIHHTRIQRFVLTMEVIRRHCTICQVNSSRSAQYPCQALISICGISHVPALSFRCHSDSHRSWLMTSLKVSEIPNLDWIRISCECASSCDLLLVSLPLRVLCCCLLSRVSGMTVQFLSVWLVRKSTQLTVHQEHTFLILHWTRQQSLDIHSSREIDQRNTVCKMCFSLSLDHQPSQRQNIPWCVSRSCSSYLDSMQVSSGRDSALVFLPKISTLSWHASNLQVLVTQVCMTSILSRTSNLVSLQWCTAILQQLLWTMSVELDYTLSSHHADSNSSDPSKTSSLPLHSVVEQCPSIRQRTWQ